VICQTNTQAKMLQDNYTISSDVVPMPFEAPSQPTSVNTETFEYRLPTAEYNLLWVGRTVEVKRLEWYLDLAEKIPEATFHVVGSANKSSEYASMLLERAQSMENVILHGRVSDQELFNLYDRAFALCCTSIIEGFPTTFLESWKIGLPVVTTFDPDDIVKDSGAGFTASSIEELQEKLMILRNNQKIYIEASKKSLKLYGGTYSPDAAIEKYQRLLSL